MVNNTKNTGKGFEECWSFSEVDVCYGSEGLCRGCAKLLCPGHLELHRIDDGAASTLHRN